MNAERLLDELVRDEGLRLAPYDDATGRTLRPGDALAGNVTIAVGLNLSAGISEAEARAWTRPRLRRAEADARRAVPSFDRLSDARQRALANMAFNLGLTRLLGFRNMLAAVAAGDFEAAAEEALASRWARQVGPRAARIAAMIREG